MKLNFIICVILSTAFIFFDLYCYKAQFVDLYNLSENNIVLSQAILRDEAEAGELTEEEEDRIIYGEMPIVISLGDNCMSLFIIKGCGLRGVAYPFDWNQTSHDALINLITNNFAQLLDKQFIQFYHHKKILNILYDGFFLIHICPSTATEEKFFEQYWPIVKDRMQRRIRRFYKAVNSNKHVYFVRFQMDFSSSRIRKDINKFATLIKSKFPKLKFTVIAVGGTNEYKVDWQIPHVVNFWAKEVIDGWAHFFPPDYEKWQKIFQNIVKMPYK